VRDGGVFFPRTSREKSVTYAFSEQLAEVEAERVEEHGLGEHGSRLAIGLCMRADFTANLETIASLPGFGMAPVGRLLYSAGPNM
jgi:hypothetical protein